MVEVLVALTIAVGIMGCVVPLLPGAYLVGGAIVVWAVLTGGRQSWAVAAIAVAIIVVGQVLKYLLPGRRLSGSGVPRGVLVAGGLGALVGFFVIPLLGMIVGFVAGVFLAELWRLRDPRQAWSTTLEAMKAVGWSVLIELVSAVLAASVWAGWVVVG